MKQIHLYLWILGIILIAVVIWFTFRVEGFSSRVAPLLLTTEQQAAADAAYAAAAPARAKFWEIVSDISGATTSSNISKVSDPDPNDPNDLMPLSFSKYISIYAMAKYNGDLSGARAALFNNYDQLQQEMHTNLYDQQQVTNWNADAKTQTCTKLDTLRASFMFQYTALSGSMQDLSGTVISMSAMHDENIGYQQALTPACPPGNLSADCISLASQDNSVYGLMAKYDTVNNTLFSNELDISNNLQTVEQTYSVLGCTNPNNFFSNGTQVYWVNNGVKYPAAGVSCSAPIVANMSGRTPGPTVAPQAFFDRLQMGPSFTCSMVASSSTQFSDSYTGSIDTGTLGIKLQQISPYYISPDTLSYITSNIPSASSTRTTIMSTSDTLIDLSSVIANIKLLTGS